MQYCRIIEKAWSNHWISTGAALGGRSAWLDWQGSRVRDKPESATRLQRGRYRIQGAAWGKSGFMPAGG
jgi:hypothetical protein